MDIELSDLFFNLPHPRFVALYVGEGEPPTSEAIEGAIIADATDTVAYYPRTFATCTIEEMTADFIKRL